VSQSRRGAPQRGADDRPLIAYEQLGSGRPLLLVHGLGATRAIWEPLHAVLAPQRQLIAIDLPGFGESPPLSVRPDPAALARAVAALLDRLGLAQVDVVGNSLGGWVAFELALLGRASSVTAIAPAGLWRGRLAPRAGLGRRLARLALPALEGLALSPHGRRLLLAGVVGNPAVVPPRQARQLVRAYLTAPGYGSANAAMRAGSFAKLAELAVPVTLIWPTRDRLVRRPRKLPENVRSVELEGAGHLPTWDRPQELAALILEASGG